MAARERPLIYTAQDVARFCEVDLKTIHHWADAGKIPHHRTEGRHLRFRRNHVVSFLRRHDYPLPVELTSVRPLVFVVEDARWAMDEQLKRFTVVRFKTAAAAIAHIFADEPDAFVCASDDGTLTGATLAAVKEEATWLVCVSMGEADIGKLGAELARLLALE